MWYYQTNLFYGNYLCHYGIKGMKWGLRRSKEELKYTRSSIEASVNRAFSKNEIRSPSGIRLSGISGHALDRIEFGDDYGNDRKVTAKQIIEAATKPLHYGEVVIDELGRPSQKQIGSNATISINPETGLIATVWKTGSKTRKKYGGK